MDDTRPLKIVYRPGYKFKQGGVYLSGISSQEALQTDLFGDESGSGREADSKFVPDSLGSIDRDIGSLCDGLPRAAEM